MDAVLLRAGCVAATLRELVAEVQMTTVALDTWVERLAPLGVEQLLINLADAEIGVLIQGIDWLFFPLPGHVVAISTEVR